METFTFYSNFTWRTVGFYLFSNSLAYRTILDVNPEWDITYHPPPGSILVNPTEGKADVNASMSQRSINVDFGYSEDMSMAYYPFNSKEEYSKAIARYNTLALYDIEACNGYSATSEIVSSGDYR